ncbi:hypothetical protein [uncultured Shewanella sp.]|uniref:hypothetical protein n=1 Tax=uncultured Shewanella sp. TaxID=173975 RepID=UPI00261B39F7|nr:hypothetical protein [uncultured Shewanella sp.]
MQVVKETGKLIITALIVHLKQWVIGVGLNKAQKKGLWHHTLDESYLAKRFKKEVLQFK